MDSALKILLVDDDRDDFLLIRPLPQNLWVVFTRKTTYLFVLIEFLLTLNAMLFGVHFNNTVL